MKKVKFLNEKLLKMNTAQIIALGFAGVIFMGALLLRLPIATVEGETTSFLDALFTATTSVCVTGLVTVTTATHWTLFGKLVILFLIQTGGLGVITFGTMIFVLFGRRISIRNRRLIQESYNLDHLSGMVILIRRIVRGMFLVEAVGAVFFAFQFVPEMGFAKGMFVSIFNSISAFCNAGIDIIDDDSLAPYVSNWLVNCTTMVLIIMGGIGFTVWWDVGSGIRKLKNREISRKRFWSNLQLHSKLAIVVTGILIVGGTFGFYVFECNNPNTIGNMSLPSKFLASLFQSVTTRTAGFLTIDQAKFTDASMILTLVLMFIGGSPMGTAGGIKTTTVAILTLTVLGYLKGKKDTEVFHRKVKEDNIRMAIVVSSIGFAFLFIASVLLSLTINTSLIDIVYEVVSALGTVGLTRGLTTQLNEVGKVVIILTMYSGRIGPITLAMAMRMRSKQVSDNIHLAEERIIIG